MSTTVYLVRHGETDWNRDSIFRGRADVPLNENGLLQAAAVAKGLFEIDIDALYSGPLTRTIQTAEAICKDRELEILINDDFTDIDYGQWQGLPLKDVKTKFAKEYKKWLTEPHKAVIPNGERLSEVKDRVWSGLQEIVRNHSDQTVLVSSHRVVNKILSLCALGLGLKDFWRIRQDNCCVDIFEFTGKDIIIHRLNDTSHLKNMEVISADF